MNNPEQLDDLIADPRQVERIAWARDILRVPDKTSGPALTGILLARLAECDFVPTPSWREGLSVLARETWDASDAVSAAMYQHQLHGEIEEFAVRFFSIPVTKRRETWNALVLRSKELPKLRERLHQLAPGLLVDPSTIVGEGRVREIVDTILRLFVLPATEQASLRREKLADFVESSSHQVAARIVREREPKVAGLTPLVNPVADAVELARKRARAIRQREKTPDQASTGGSSVLIALAPFLFLVAIGVFGRLLSSSGSKKPVQPVRGWESRQQNLGTEQAAELFRKVQEDMARREAERKSLEKLAADEFRRRASEKRRTDELLKSLMDNQDAQPDDDLAAHLARETARMKAEGKSAEEIERMRKLEIIRRELLKLKRLNKLQEASEPPP